MPDEMRQALPDQSARHSCIALTAGGYCSRRNGHAGQHATLGGLYLDEIDRLRAENEALNTQIAGIASVLDRGIPDERKLATITRLVHNAAGASDDFEVPKENPMTDWPTLILKADEASDTERALATLANMARAEIEQRDGSGTSPRTDQTGAPHA
jgi:hypothetical protein